MVKQWNKHNYVIYARNNYVKSEKYFEISWTLWTNSNMDVADRVGRLWEEVVVRLDFLPWEPATLCRYYDHRDSEIWIDSNKLLLVQYLLLTFWSCVVFWLCGNVWVVLCQQAHYCVRTKCWQIHYFRISPPK